MIIATAPRARERRRGGSAAARVVRAVGLLFALALAAAAPRAADAQASTRTVRLAIMEVGDSTFSFDASNLRWIKPGERGMAVDPKRRDALVARFDVLSVANGRAVALVTGATTVLTTDHVVVMEIPERPWYRSSLFWSGATIGTLLGVLVRSL